MATLRHRLLATFSGAARARAGTLKRFIKKTGLVHFGTVDQHDDEHEVIRGITASTSHKDTQYAVGTFLGRDVAIVDRLDTIKHPKEAQSTLRLVVLQIDLDQSVHLPHIFLLPQGSEAAYRSLLSHHHTLQPVNGMLDGHAHDFHSRYQLLTTPTQAQRIDTLLPSDVTNVVAARLWPHALEIVGSKLYVYITEGRPSESLLQATLESSCWLADALDEPQQKSD